MEDSARAKVDRAKGMTPQTAIVTVRWRPTPKVYDFRTSLLSFLEDRKLLLAFQVEDDTSHAMVSASAEVSLSPRGISIGISDGMVESEVLVPIFDHLLQVLKPRITTVYSQFQYLISLAGFSDYSKARSAALAGIFGSLAEDLSLVDTAVLIDGALGDPETTFKAEFGIVQRTEAGERLQHVGGSRISSADEPDFSHVEWGERDLPELSLYIDSRWHDHEEIPSDLNPEWLIERVRRYEGNGSKLAAKLFERTVFGQQQPKAGTQ